MRETKAILGKTNMIPIHFELLNAFLSSCAATLNNKQYGIEEVVERFVGKFSTTLKYKK